MNNMLSVLYKSSPILTADYSSSSTIGLATAGKYLEDNINIAITAAFEYETGIFTPTSDIARATVSFTNSHDSVPFFVAMADMSGAYTVPNNSSLEFSFVDLYKLFGTGYPYDSSSVRYGVASYVYKGSGNPTISGVQMVYDSDNSSTSNNTYSHYWVTASNFHPYSGSSSRYWRANRNYKWVAVWK